MSAPWTEGPRELLQHAADHLTADGDFDRRIAMISIDNAVELAVKTYLGLPKRSRGTDGPCRKELESARESFPMLLYLLDKYTGDKLTGINLGDVEWYHRLRNQLYHAGNGITVDRSRVEAYFQIASTLFENLFNLRLEIDESNAINTRTGEFLHLWAAFDHGLRGQLPEKKGPAYYWKLEYMQGKSPEVARLWESLVQFRNMLVHSLKTPSTDEIDARINDLRELMRLLGIDPV